MVYNGNSHGGESIEIYADVLLVINFTMDFLALFLTGRILRLPLRGKRLAAASLLGALSDLLRMVFPAGRVLWGFITVFVGITMCLVAYNERPRRTVPVFIASELALGGIVSVVCRYIRLSGVGYAGDRFSHFAFPAMIAGVACVIYGRSRAVSETHGTAEVSVTIDKKEVRLHMLIDSGNLLTDPISGRAVILVQSSKLSPLIPDAEDLTPQSIPCSLFSNRLRLIPAKGIGSHCLLVGLIADRIEVNGQEKDAVVALSPDSFDGYDGILPPSLT